MRTLCLLLSLCLVGCGGGDDAGPPSPPAKSYATPTHDQVMAFAEALNNGDEKAVPAAKQWVADGLNPDRVIARGNTPLMIAAGNGYIGVVEFLLENGAEINKRDNTGSTALMIVANDLECKLDLLKLLVEQGADVKARDVAGKTALDFAKFRKHEACIKFLEASGG